MTEQETMQGLRACWEYKDCSKCPFVLELNDCHSELAHEAYKTIERLRAENAALKERLEKAVELPRVECIMTREWLSRELIGAIMFEWCVLYKKGSYLMAEPCLSKGAAEIRLAELNGGSND